MPAASIAFHRLVQIRGAGGVFLPFPVRPFGPIGSARTGSIPGKDDDGNWKRLPATATGAFPVPVLPGVPGTGGIQTP